MKRIKLKKRKNKLRFRKKLVLISTLVLLLVLGIGYSALSVDLSINGSITVKKYLETTLYDEMENAYIEGYAHEYTGNHHDSFSEEPTKPIYYWYAPTGTDGDAQANEILDKNNVIFAKHCWQMIRTTDTGGVKLIYNGEPENDQCLNTRGNHVGYGSKNSMSLYTTYYYGTGYEYNKTNGLFSLTGTVTTGTVQPGQYTCKKTSLMGTCSTLYLVDKLNSGTSFYDVFSLNSNSHYSQFGSLQFNYSADNNTPASAGYMYNTGYYVGHIANVFEITNSSAWTIDVNCYYSDTVDYNTITPNEYTLTNPILISTLSDYSTLIGKYVLDSSGTHAPIIRYVTGIDGTNLYYKELVNGDLNTSLTVGSSYTQNGNTYTLTNPTNVTYIDWFNTSYFYMYRGKYVCDGNNTSCTNIKHIETSSNPDKYDFWYFDTNNTYSYSENVSYDGETYTLTGDIKTFWDLFDSTNISYLPTHHYTCLENGTSCTTLGYITYISNPEVYVVKISGVANISEALNNMLSIDNVNQKDSLIKKIIDAWYKNYMTNYTSKLEDTIFCNDRSISNLGGWDPNGGSLSTPLQFKNKNIDSDLNCTNITDKFSVSNTKAQLTYPVGLLTSSEANLLNNKNILKTEKSWWLLSPNSFSYTRTYSKLVYTDGSFSTDAIYISQGIRPVISLKPGIKYESGNGSMANPYVVRTSG